MKRHLALAALLIALVLGGCSAVDDGSVTRADGSVGRTSQEPEPGLVRLSNSEAEAMGTVVYRRDQGGFFAVADISHDASTKPNPRILAVLVNEDGTPRVSDLAPLVGSYCRFIGSVLETQATTFTAPMLTFETYHILARP